MRPSHPKRTVQEQAIHRAAQPETEAAQVIHVSVEADRARSEKETSAQKCAGKDCNGQRWCPHEYLRSTASYADESWNRGGTANVPERAIELPAEDPWTAPE